MPPGDCRDERVPEAEGPDRLQWAGVRKDLCASDASACARPGEAADVAPQRLEDLEAEDAGRLAGRERGVREQDASYLQAHPFVLSALQDEAAELCRQGAARSAEQSCAVQAVAADPQSLVGQPDAAVRAPLAAQMRQQPTEVQERMAQLLEPAASPDGAVEGRQQAKAAPIPKQRAFPLVWVRPEVAEQAQALKVQRAVELRQAEPVWVPEGQLLAWPRAEAQARDVPVAPQPLPSFA